jgi:hypothetical protein
MNCLKFPVKYCEKMKKKWKNYKNIKKISGGDGSAPPLNLLLQSELLALTVQLAPNKALSLSLSEFQVGVPLPRASQPIGPTGIADIPFCTKRVRKTGTEKVLRHYSTPKTNRSEPNV